MKVYKPNPRQYTATIAQLPHLEVWFQRATDVVRKLVYGDVDIGIVGFDMFSEIADNSSEVVVVHDALGFGGCHLGLGIPTSGKFANIDSMEQLRSMPEWSETNPLRVVTGYHNIARRYFKEQGFEHVVLLSADGALEAAPLMGSADIILDLISTGVTLRENNLKEIEGGKILESEGVLVANRRALKQDPRLLKVVHELIERFEAHLKADKFYSVIANMRGKSTQDVASKICNHSSVLRGLQGPTVTEVYPPSSSGNGAGEERLFSATMCIPKNTLYQSIGDLRKIGGSGVLVQPMTYIFDEEPERWSKLLKELES